MTADINVILQLLQRQMAPVPPAYSAVSPSPHTPHPTTLYNTGAPTIHTVPAIHAVQIDRPPSLLQVFYTVICVVISLAVKILMLIMRRKLLS